MDYSSKILISSILWSENVKNQWLCIPLIKFLSKWIFWKTRVIIQNGFFFSQKRTHKKWIFFLLYMGFRKIHLECIPFGKLKLIKWIKKHFEVMQCSRATKMNALKLHMTVDTTYGTTWTKRRIILWTIYICWWWAINDMKTTTLSVEHQPSCF